VWRGTRALIYFWFYFIMMMRRAMESDDEHEKQNKKGGRVRKYNAVGTPVLGLMNDSFIYILI